MRNGLLHKQKPPTRMNWSGISTRQRVCNLDGSQALCTIKRGIMTNKEKAEMYEKIRKHGEILLKLFPEAKEKNPVKLCKSLRRYERKISAITLALCNGEIDQEEADKDLDRLYIKVDMILLSEPQERVAFFINRDPRGYALKIPTEDQRIKEYGLYRDLAGYGILAPNFDPDYCMTSPADKA